MIVLQTIDDWNGKHRILVAISWPITTGLLGTMQGIEKLESGINW